MGLRVIVSRLSERFFLQLFVSGLECFYVKARSSIWHFLAARSSHGEAFVYLKKFPLCLAQPIWHGWFPLSLLLLTRSRISVHPVLLPQCIYRLSHYMSVTMRAGFCAVAFEIMCMCEGVFRHLVSGFAGKASAEKALLLVAITPLQMSHSFLPSPVYKRGRRQRKTESNRVEV